MKRRGIIVLSAALLLVCGCVSLQTSGRALRDTRTYLASDTGRALYPNVTAGEPIPVRDEEGERLHGHVVPLISGGLVIGYGESLATDGSITVTRLNFPRASLFRTTREEAQRWAVEATERRGGPFQGAAVDGPHLFYREPRGYVWGVRFLLPGGPIVYSGRTLVIIGKAF